MEMKEIVIRIGCTLLGSFLTLCIVFIYDKYTNREDSATVSVEEIPVVEASMTNDEFFIAEDVKLYTDYEEEAKEKYKEMQASESVEETWDEEENETELAIETVSANSIDAAPVKWKKDYPTLNSTMLLEEKELERSSYEETLAVNAFDKEVIANSTIDFSDVKITIMGDSITVGGGLPEEEKVTSSYPAVLQEILGCKEIVNLGIGGSTISAAGDDAMVNRWTDIPKDSDIIIVFGGTNDALFENKWQYGILEYNKRMTDATFCGDLDKLVSKIEYVYLNHNEENYCKLIFINPPSTILNDAVYEINPVNMVHQKEFAKAINEIAPFYSFEVIDLYNNNILNTHDDNVRMQFMPDGIHPNVEGHRVLAEHIASQIIQRIEQ